MLLKMAGRKVQKCRVVEEADTYYLVRAWVGLQDYHSMLWQEDQWISKDSSWILEVLG